MKTEKRRSVLRLVTVREVVPRLKHAVPVALALFLLLGTVTRAAPSPATWPTSDEWVMLYDDVTGECSNQEWRDINGTYYYVDDDFVYFLMCIADNGEIPGWPTTSSGFAEARYKWFIDTVDEDLSVSGTTANYGEFLLMLEDATDQGAGDPPTDAGWGSTDEDQYGELTLIDDLANVGFTARWDSATPPEYKLNANNGSSYWRRVVSDPDTEPVMPSNGIQKTPLAGTVPPAGGTTNPDIGYKMGVLQDTPCQSGNGVAMFVSRALIGDPNSVCVIPATDQENNNLDQAPNCDRPEETTCLPVVLEGSLEVVKDLIPSTDPGLFNLQIDGVTEEADASDGGTTGEITVDPGDHTVGEVAGTGTSLSDYNTSISCVDAAGVVVTSSSDAGPLDVTVGGDDDIVCTITNERKTGQLEVVKDLIPSTDPGLFNLQIDGVTEEADASDGGTTGELTVNMGTHTVGEVAGTGTSLSDYNTSILCVDAAGVVVASSSGAGPLDVTVGEDDDVVCTITNERKALPVGGSTLPLSLAALLAPWLGFATLLLVGTVLVWRCKATQR